MDEYTAIIHNRDGENSQVDFIDPDSFLDSMQAKKHHVAWAKLFVSKTGKEVISLELGELS